MSNQSKDEQVVISPNSVCDPDMNKPLKAYPAPAPVAREKQEAQS
jgi:hypothetical protein